ncbi:MAG: hypothetical protein F6J93_11400, partial [Oscillatoria sp. SIO1A7]|nr:hypothetical protein [Oscillatoria sp. SIO1A7]
MIFTLFKGILKYSLTVSSCLLICLVVASSLIWIYQKLLKNKNRYKDSIKTFISASFLILLTYSPVIRSHYVFNDDYYLWIWQKGVCYTHPEYLFIFSIGRPIANIFLCPLWSMVDSLESANLARLVAVLLTAITFFVINRFLIHLKFKIIFSYFIPLIIVTSFSFQVYNSWIMAAYIPSGIIFSILSIFLAIKLIESIENKEKHLKLIETIKLLGNKRFRLFYILSIVLYILTLSTYQPSAGFFTCFAAIYILKRKEIGVASLRFMTAVFGSIFLVSNLVYFSILKAFILILSYDKFIPTYDPRVLRFIFDPSFITGKLIWFLKGPFLNSANILNIENRSLSAIFLIVLGVSLIILYLEDIKHIANTIK